jgi:hypothetical protein
MYLNKDMAHQYTHFALSKTLSRFCFRQRFGFSACDPSCTERFCCSLLVWFGTVLRTRVTCLSSKLIGLQLHFFTACFSSACRTPRVALNGAHFLYRACVAYFDLLKIQESPRCVRSENFWNFQIVFQISQKIYAFRSTSEERLKILRNPCGIMREVFCIFTILGFFISGRAPKVLKK